MKLESLTLDKFKDCSLKKEQLFALNGGGTKTLETGTICHWSQGQAYLCDYAYDIQRDDGNGGTFLTFHGLTNWRDPGDNC